jgi:hypothetical protein
MAMSADNANLDVRLDRLINQLEFELKIMMFQKLEENHKDRILQEKMDEQLKLERRLNARSRKGAFRIAEVIENVKPPIRLKTKSAK